MMGGVRIKIKTPDKQATPETRAVGGHSNVTVPVNRTGRAPSANALMNDPVRPDHILRLHRIMGNQSISRMLSLRGKAGPMAFTAVKNPMIQKQDSIPGNTDEQKKNLTWLEVLPKAHNKESGKGITAVDSQKGKEHELRYTNSNNIAVTPGNPAGDNQEIETITDPEKLKGMKGEGKNVRGEALSLEILGETLLERILRNIIETRNSIEKRPISRDPFTHKGNFYKPEWASDSDNPYDDAHFYDPKAVEYNAWQKGAIHTRSYDPKNDNDKMKWLLFNTLQGLEGTVGTVTASSVDKTLTIGVGFSSGGAQAEEVAARMFDDLPEMKSLAFNAGLIAFNNKFIVADMEKRWILEGTDAANYIQTNKALLSLIINVSQGNQKNSAGEQPTGPKQNKQRQAMLNAQWMTFLTHALAGIDQTGILNWPISSAALAVHSRHAIQATFPWSFWLDHANPDIKSMVRAIYQRLRETNQMGWLFNICNGPYHDIAVAVQNEKN
jgi:hypothetical protein